MSIKVLKSAIDEGDDSLMRRVFPYQAVPSGERAREECRMIKSAQKYCFHSNETKHSFTPPLPMSLAHARVMFFYLQTLRFSSPFISPPTSDPPVHIWGCLSAKEPGSVWRQQYKCPPLRTLATKLQNRLH